MVCLSKRLPVFQKSKLIKIEDILIRGKLKINALLPEKSMNPNP